MSARRVLFVNPTTGGIGHYVHNLSGALAWAGVETALITSAEEPYELADFPSPLTIYRTLREHPLPAGRSLRAFVGRRVAARVGPRRNNDAVAEAARAFGAQVIHYQWPLGGYAQAGLWDALRRRTGLPIVYTAHDVLPHELTWEQIRADARLRAAWGELYRAADHLIAHAERLKQQMVETFDLPAEKITVLPHGNYTFLADQDRVWDRARARASLGLAGDETAILFFGFIREYKGLETLIEAAAGMRERSGVRLLVVGKPYPWPSWEETPYARLAAERGVDRRLLPVTEYVPLGDIARYFRASDIVALPYHRASQSGVLQMAYGFARATVCTDTGGLKEAAIPGETALFVPPRDPEALAEALDALVADPGRREAVGRAGRCHAETAYSWEPIAARTLEIYERLGGAA